MSNIHLEEENNQRNRRDESKVTNRKKVEKAQTQAFEVGCRCKISKNLPRGNQSERNSDMTELTKL